MKSQFKQIQVNGQIYNVWSDYVRKCTFAQNQNGEIKTLKSSGYIINDLTIRKSIAIMFNLKTFRK